MMGFRADQSGAMTVDWVVLTAALVGLGVAVFGTVSGGVDVQAKRIERCLSVYGHVMTQDNPAMIAEGSQAKWMGVHCQIQAKEIQ
ncbi:MAG: hypothetical protein ACU0CO_07170 [Shimia sp.]